MYESQEVSFGLDHCQELPPSEEVHASLVCELMNEEGTEGMAGAAGSSGREVESNPQRGHTLPPTNYSCFRGSIAESPKDGLYGPDPM